MQVRAHILRPNAPFLNYVSPREAREKMHLLTGEGKVHFQLTWSHTLMAMALNARTSERADG